MNSNSSFPNGIILKPTKHTSGVAKTFYVYPIDPKTEKAVTSSLSTNVTLTIWQEATGIELQKGNFDITGSPDGGYNITADHLTHKKPAGTYYIYAKLIPEYTKPGIISVEKQHNGYALHTIQNTLESGGRTKVSFGTMPSGIGVAEEDILKFSAEGVSTTLKVRIN